MTKKKNSIFDKKGKKYNFFGQPLTLVSWVLEVPAVFKEFSSQVSPSSKLSLKENLSICDKKFMKSPLDDQFIYDRQMLYFFYYFRNALLFKVLDSQLHMTSDVFSETNFQYDFSQIL